MQYILLLTPPHTLASSEDVQRPLHVGCVYPKFSENLPLLTKGYFAEINIFYLIFKEIFEDIYALPWIQMFSSSQFMCVSLPVLHIKIKKKIVI